MALTRRRGARGRALNALLVLASIAIGFAGIEIALRAGYHYPVFARVDSTLGWHLRPNLAGLSVLEGTAVMQTNAQGFRARRDWTIEKAGRTFRVAVLGDSFVESSNLAFDDSLPERIGAGLATCPALSDRSIEMMNFGVSGYGTAQEVLLMQSDVLPYTPDLVVLVVYLGNDVANNSRALTRDFAEVRPYFLIRDGELQLDDTFGGSDAFAARKRQSAVGDLVNQSRALQVLKQLYLGEALPRHESAPIDPAHSPARDKAPAPEYVGMYTGVDDPQWSQAWAVTEQLIALARDLSHRAGVDFAVVAIPEPLEAFPDAAMREARAAKLGIADLNGPHSRFGNSMARRGVEHFSLLDPLRLHAEAHAVHLFGFPPKLGDGHLNPLGNDVAGNAIAAYLCSRMGPK